MKILYVVILCSGICVAATQSESKSTEDMIADLKRHVDTKLERLQSGFDKKLNELMENVDTRFETMETNVNHRLDGIKAYMLTEIRQDSNTNNGSGQGLEDKLKLEMEKLATIIHNAISSEKQFLRDNLQELHSRMGVAEERVVDNSHDLDLISLYLSKRTDSGDIPAAAHLMGSNRKQTEHPGAQLFPIVHWTEHTDLAFTNRVHYRLGRIVIPKDGLYYVYSQLSFLEVVDNPTIIETVSQSLSHYIYRYNIVYPNGGEESMIQNSFTMCRGQNRTTGEYTSYLGAVFYLRQGDEVFVKVSNLTLIVWEPKLNYFGLFQVK